MNPLGLLPEATRSALNEARPSRLALGLAATLGLGWAAAAGSRHAPDPGSALIAAIVAMQGLTLLVIGTAKAASSIGSERSARTWDLQRLTPQSSLRLVLGKLVGAPLFAYFLVAAFFPWVIKGLSDAGNLNWGQVATNYGLLLSTAFFMLSAGLLISAYVIEAVGGTMTSLAGAGLGFFSMTLLSFYGIGKLFKAKPIPEVAFYGQTFPIEKFWIASAAAFGLWALAGAVWRVGEDFLEPRRFWRLPAFMACVCAYVAGFHEGLTWAACVKYSFVFLSGFCYAAGLLNSDSVDRWRHWLGSRGKPGWLDKTPVWLTAASSYAVLALGCSAASAYWLPGLGDAFRYPGAQAGFLLRDLAFLQWFRLGKNAQATRMALLIWAGAYIGPKIFLAIFKLKDYAFFFSPVPAEGFSPFANALPALLQGGLMLGLLFFEKRRALQLPSTD